MTAMQTCPEKWFQPSEEHTDSQRLCCSWEGKVQMWFPADIKKMFKLLYLRALVTCSSFLNNSSARLARKLIGICCFFYTFFFLINQWSFQGFSSPSQIRLLLKQWSAAWSTYCFQHSHYIWRWQSDFWLNFHCKIQFKNHLSERKTKL